MHISIVHARVPGSCGVRMRSHDIDTTAVNLVSRPLSDHRRKPLLSRERRAGRSCCPHEAESLHILAASTVTVIRYSIENAPHVIDMVLDRRRSSLERHQWTAIALDHDTGIETSLEVAIPSTRRASPPRFHARTLLLCVIEKQAT